MHLRWISRTPLTTHSGQAKRTFCALPMLASCDGSTRNADREHSDTWWDRCSTARARHESHPHQEALDPRIRPDPDIQQPTLTPDLHIVLMNSSSTWRTDWLRSPCQIRVTRDLHQVLSRIPGTSLSWYDMCAVTFWPPEHLTRVGTNEVGHIGLDSTMSDPANAANRLTGGDW